MANLLRWTYIVLMGPIWDMKTFHVKKILFANPSLTWHLASVSQIPFAVFSFLTVIN